MNIAGPMPAPIFKFDSVGHESRKGNDFASVHIGPAPAPVPQGRFDSIGGETRKHDDSASVHIGPAPLPARSLSELLLSTRAF